MKRQRIVISTGKGGTVSIAVGRVHAPDRASAAAGSVKRSRIGGPAGEILRLQRMAGNRAVTHALQRCGPTPCNCSDEQREAAATESAGEESDSSSSVQRAIATPSTVQRVGPDFEVKGESQSAATTPMSIFFDKDSATVSPTEDKKFATLGWMPLPLVTLKG